MAEQTLREKCERRLSELKSDRSAWDGDAQDLAAYIQPGMGRFATSDRNKRAARNRSKIIDSTGTVSLRTLRSGMQMGITSPARPWFQLTFADKDLMEFGPVKAWLYDIQTRMREILQASNVYNALHSLYGELGLFGTGSNAYVEDFDSVISAVPMTFGEYWLGTGANGMVDTLYRECEWSVAQVVERFGLDACSPTIRTLWTNGNLGAAVPVAHAIEPNPDRDVRKADARNKRWRSVYWERDSDRNRLLRMSGYDQFPATVPRWDVTSNDTYGTTWPGLDALGDVKQLQTQQLRKAEALDKGVRPPMIANVSMAGKHMSLVPGGITYVNPVQGFTGFQPAYQVQIQVDPLLRDMEETRARVRQAFFADVFLMISQSNGQMTATEVIERREEKMIALGPVLERLQKELLAPLIERLFAIMMSRGLVPPAPEEIQGVPIRVDFVSILAQAQKALATSSIERVIGVVGNLAAGYPPILDKIDFDQTVDEYADLVGAPPRMIRPDDAVEQIRQGRQRQEQMAQAAALGGQGAQAAKVLSETDTRGPNALTQMLGLS